MVKYRLKKTRQNLNNLFLITSKSHCSFIRMNRNKPILLLLVFLLLIPSISVSKTITGETISVEDGDTITILNNQRRQTKIRLYGMESLGFEFFKDLKYGILPLDAFNT